MEDYRIVDLYWARNETAITESDRKYGGMLKSLSYSLLSSREDAEECVNDTYLALWNAIPPAEPDPLAGFVFKTGRNLALKRRSSTGNRTRGRRRGTGSSTRSRSSTACLVLIRRSTSSGSSPSSPPRCWRSPSELPTGHRSTC